MNTHGNCFESVGAVVDGVHAGHDGEEDLGGADVGGGFFAADVLFAGLDGEAVGGVAVGVFGDADDAAGEFAGEFGFAGHEGGVGSAEAHGDAEALGVADGDVGSAAGPFAGGFDEGEGEEVGGGDDLGVVLVGGFGEGAVVEDSSICRWVLDEDATELFERESPRLARRGFDQLFGVADCYFDAEPFGAGFDDGDGLGVDVVGDEEFGAVFVEAVAHVHGFGGGGGFVEHAGVGEGEGGEVADHGLEIEEGFEAALGDLGLVGGVLGVPAGVFEDVAEDDAGGDGVVVTHAEEGFEDFVFGGEGFDGGEGFGFGLGAGEVEGVGEADARGDGLVDEFVEGGCADGGEHGLLLGLVGADVAAGEGVKGLEGIGGFDGGDYCGLPEPFGWEGVFWDGVS